MKSVLFIHRSVGAQTLARTNIVDELRTRGVQMIDLNANDLTTGGPGSHRVRTTFPISRGRTDPADLGEFFQRALDDQSLLESLASFDAVILKSCFTIWSATAAEIERYAQPYQAVVQSYLRKAPRQIVFLATPPPPRRGMTSEKKEAIKKFLSCLERLASDHPNAQLTDIYHELANSRGILRKRYRSFFVFDQHPNRAGSARIATLLRETIVSRVSP